MDGIGQAKMSKRTVNNRVHTREPMFNWLKWLDEKVGKFPIEADWTKHPPFHVGPCNLFMMARYPQLRRPVADEVLRQEFDRGERQISQHPEAAIVLEKLDERQRTQLAALSLDIMEALKTYGAERRFAERVKKLAGEAHRRIRVLGRNLEKAQRELKNLRNYAARLDAVMAWDYVSTASRCLELLTSLKTAETEFYESLKADYPRLEGPVAVGMVELYWFFREGVGMTGDEAEIQVGLLRNALWKKFGISQVNIRRTYDKVQSAGCDSVRRAARRLKGTLL